MALSHLLVSPSPSLVLASAFKHFEWLQNAFQSQSKTKASENKDVGFKKLAADKLNRETRFLRQISETRIKRSLGGRWQLRRMRIQARWQPAGRRCHNICWQHRIQRQGRRSQSRRHRLRRGSRRKGKPHRVRGG